VNLRGGEIIVTSYAVGDIPTVLHYSGGHFFIRYLKITGKMSIWAPRYLGTLIATLANGRGEELWD